MSTGRVREKHKSHITYKELHSDLSIVASKWFPLGTQLKIHPGVLRNMKTSNNECFQHLMDVIQHWLDDGIATKEKLVKAVKSPSIRNHRLAETIAGSQLPDKLEIEHYSDVVNVVGDLAAHWYHLGVQLGITPAKLREFEEQPCNVQRELDNMLYFWMMGSPRVEDLIQALQSGGVRQNNLALKLEQKYRGCTLVMEIPKDQLEEESHTESEEAMETPEDLTEKKKVEKGHTENEEVPQYETLTHPPEPMEVSESDTASREDVVTLATKEPQRSAMDRESTDSDEEFLSCSDGESQDQPPSQGEPSCREPPEGSDTVVSKPFRDVPREGLPTKKQYFPGFPLQDRRVESDDGGRPAYEKYDAYKPAKGRKSVKLSFQEVNIQRGDKKTSDDEVYEMKRPHNGPHGTAVIINNEKFTRLHDREGTHIDEGNLIETFRYLGYTVEVYRDQTAAQIREVFRKMKSKDHNHCNSFVCCILSHGEDGRVNGADGQPVKIADLATELDGANCATLRDKPKMFFFQACQGTGIDMGCAKVETDSNELDGAAVSQPERQIEENSTPKMSDFFFGYATPPGYFAYRNLDRGSWYITELCQALCACATYTDVNTMIEQVHKEVAKYEYNGQKQAPWINSSLRNKVYFF